MYSFRLANIAVISALFVAACGTSSQVDDQQVVEEPEPEQAPQFDVDKSGWSEERLAIEDQFLTWLASSESLDDALAQSPARLKVVTEEKAAGQQELEQDLRRFAEESSDPEVAGWAFVRLGQTYLHFGCELDAMVAPQGLTEDQRKAYELSIQDLVEPLLSQATTRLADIEDREIPVWSDKAAYILAEIDPATDESCAATADFWLPEDRITSEERLATAAEGCADADISACREALRFASDDETAEFLKRSCELSPEHCREAAMHFIEIHNPLVAEELLNIGCDGGEFNSCRLRAAYAHPDLKEQYYTRCVDGDYLGCVNFVRVAEATERSGLHDICGAPKADDFDDHQNVETACADDGDASSCLAQGAYLFHNQPEPDQLFDAAMVGDGGDDALAGRGTGGGMGLIGSGSESNWDADFEANETDCHGGDVHACMRAGKLLGQLDRDPTLFYSIACNHGHGAGCYQKGHYLESGTRANELFEKGCQHEYAPACQSGAERLQHSQETDEHHREIVDLLRTTCTGDNISTCRPLARYFESRGDDLTNQTCALYYNSISCNVDGSARCNPLLRW